MAAPRHNDPPCPCLPPDLYDVIKHHRERGTAMLPHVFKSAMHQVGAGVGATQCTWGVGGEVAAPLWWAHRAGLL